MGPLAILRQKARVSALAQKPSEAGDELRRLASREVAISSDRVQHLVGREQLTNITEASECQSSLEQSTKLVRPTISTATRVEARLSSQHKRPKDLAKKAKQMQQEQKPEPKERQETSTKPPSTSSGSNLLRPRPSFLMLATGKGLRRRLSGQAANEQLELVKRLSRGGSGAVYEGLLTVPDRTKRIRVAAKVVNADATASAMREVALLRDLDHPNLVRFIAHLDLVELELAVVCLGVCEHGDLFTVMSSRGVSSMEIKSLARDIANGLGYLHSKNIVHCDIKPENVGVDADGTARLLDLGLAIKLSSLSNRVVSSAGTLQYASPEVLRREPIGVERDWWSFGVMLFEMSFCCLPWQLDSFDLGECDAQEVCQRVCMAPLSYPYEGQDSIWDELVYALCFACLRKSRVARLQDYSTIVQHAFFTAEPLE